VLNEEDIVTGLANQRLPQEQILLDELNHRVKNEFTAAISIVSLAAARAGNDEAKATLSEVAERLHRHAYVHRALEMPEHDDSVQDAEAYLRQLCLSISRSYLDDRKIKLLLSIEPFLLPAGDCWRLGMIVYELVVNAAQHAFGGRSGQIRVTASRDAAFVKYTVQDSGTTTGSIHPGRGLKIVAALSDALGGLFKQTFGPRGSTSLLVFPCARAPNDRKGRLPKKTGSRRAVGRLASQY
jgi:two-component sensor histidine kinase